MGGLFTVDACPPIVYAYDASTAALASRTLSDSSKLHLIYVFMLLIVDLFSS